MKNSFRNFFVLIMAFFIALQMPHVYSVSASQENNDISKTFVTKKDLLISLKQTASKSHILTPGITEEDDQPITREDAARIVQNLFHLIDGRSPFSDVPSYNPYAAAIGALSNAGILNGIAQGKFGYGNMLTKMDAAKLNKNLSLYFKKREANYKPFKVASIEFNPKIHELDKNVDALYDEFEKAFKDGAKLAVAPEMATTGYMYTSRNDIAPYVDTLPGKTTDKFSKLTQKYHSYIVFGMAEKDLVTGLFYNSAALVGPNGYIGKYRKTHLATTDEYWAAWGNLGVPVFATGIGNISINICMDSAYFESARLAAVEGADILAFPTNSSGQAIAALPARAMQNGLYIVAANRSDTESGWHMVGTSAIWSPQGKKLAETPYSPSSLASAPSVISTAKVDPANYHNKNKNRLWKRRPELYKELTLFIAPWDDHKSTAPVDINAASLQYTPVAGNKKANQTKIEKLLEGKEKEATQKKEPLNFVVLPELSLTGPAALLNSKQIHENAEPVNGPTYNYMKKLATQYNTAIVYGIIESEGSKLYNTAVLVDHDGTLVGKYRETHLDNKDKEWATAGDQIPVFKTKTLGNIGLLIGEDAAFPETAGVLAVERADIIAVPSAWNGQYGGDMEINSSMFKNSYPAGSMPVWDGIAIGAQSYTIIANYVGTKEGYKGRSALYTLDPIYGLDQPAVATDSKEEGLFFHFKTLHSDWWFNQEKLIESRRTDYYAPLVTNNF